MSELSADAVPGDVRHLLDRIDEAWRAFLAVLDGIPDERMSEGGAVGNWSLKDLFGHVAFWDEQGIAELERTLGGLPEEERDWQAMNEADYALRRHRTLPEQRGDMFQAHAALVERLEGVAGIDAAPIDAAIKGATYEHYEEHIPDVQSWRARTGL
jgi:hypothetical protein